MSTAHWQGRRLTIPAAWPVRSSPAAHPWAIISAALSPVLLTGGYLVSGALQPASYSPMRKTISAMAGQAGTDPWIMTGGILLAAGCYLVTAAGLTGARAPARALLIVAGLAGIGIAASPEPATGATPRHLAWTVLAAVTTAVWPAFAAPRTSPRPPILTGYGSAAATAVFVALLGWLFIETRDGSVLGLAERLTSSIQTCWPFIIALTLRRARQPAPGAGPGPKRETAMTQPGAGNRRPRPQPAPHPAGARNQETLDGTDRSVVRRGRHRLRLLRRAVRQHLAPRRRARAASGDEPGRPDTGSYEVIYLGGQAAVVVPVTDFLRPRALELHAFAEELRDAEDAAAPARSPAEKRRPGSDRPGRGASLPFPDRPHVASPPRARTRTP